ncbi:MAG: hypothetical protein U0527_00345 [Candidatus Eisenbacteria bacterium]
MALTREEILAPLKAALEPKPYVHAMWEGGAVSFDRADQYSDIDLQVDADDDHVDDVIRITEEVITRLSPIELRYELPQPSWHGHAQVFYRLERAGRFLLLDFVVMKHSAKDKLIQPEIHGRPVVHFDKSGVTTVPPLDLTELERKLAERRESLKVTFPLFQSLVEKEIHRKNWAEAIAFYHAFTLRPLVEWLRIHHCPVRHNFYARYYKYDLPADVAVRLEPLFWVGSPDDLKRKLDEAGAWFRALAT